MVEVAVGTPGGVSREGGLIVRRAVIVSFGWCGCSFVRVFDILFEGIVCANETATTASATASSVADGSKKIFVPAVMTSSVIGGVDSEAEAEAEAASMSSLRSSSARGYNHPAASQSSSHSGSSSGSDTSRGKRVSSSARCNASDTRGSG